MPQKITIPTQKESLTGLFYKAEAPVAQVLFMHGGGGSDKSRAAYLAKYLQKQNVTSLCFDFSGHGESTGALGEASLYRRAVQARAAAGVLASQVPENTPLTLCGSSMGGHVALMILEALPVSGLALFCPAVYSQKAEKICFGEEKFTQILHQKRSFAENNVMNKLAEFTGAFFMCLGAADTVIPPEVVALYRANSLQASPRDILTLSAPHKLHLWLQAHPKAQKEVCRRLVDTLPKTLK